MQEINLLSLQVCSKLAYDPSSLSDFVRQSVKELTSLSKLVPPLTDYGSLLTSKKLLEAASSGESSPCYSDNEEQDLTPKIRSKSHSIYEIGKIFLDSSATIEISQVTQDSSWYSWLLIHGLSEENYIKILLGLLEKHLGFKYESSKTVVYKGLSSLLLECKDHFTAQKTYTFLVEDLYAKAFIKNRWPVIRIHNRMSDPKYMSQFFGVIMKNLPRDCSQETISNLIKMNCPKISWLSIEIPVLIGDSYASLVRTKTLEDAEMLALTVNDLMTENGVIQAALHPSCNPKQQNAPQGPFKAIKGSYQNNETAAGQSKSIPTTISKTQIKDILSILKNPTSKPNDLVKEAVSEQLTQHLVNGDNGKAKGTQEPQKGTYPEPLKSKGDGKMLLDNEPESPHFIAKSPSWFMNNQGIFAEEPRNEEASKNYEVCSSLEKVDQNSKTAPQQVIRKPSPPRETNYFINDQPVESLGNVAPVNNRTLPPPHMPQDYPPLFDGSKPNFYTHTLDMNAPQNLREQPFRPHDPIPKDYWPKKEERLENKMQEAQAPMMFPRPMQGNPFMGFNSGNYPPFPNQQAIIMNQPFYPHQNPYIGQRNGLPLPGIPQNTALNHETIRNENMRSIPLELKNPINPAVSQFPQQNFKNWEDKGFSDLSFNPPSLYNKGKNSKKAPKKANSTLNKKKVVAMNTSSVHMNPLNAMYANEERKIKAQKVSLKRLWKPKYVPSLRMRKGLTKKYLSQQLIKANNSEVPLANRLNTITGLTTKTDPEKGMRSFGQKDRELNQYYSNQGYPQQTQAFKTQINDWKIGLNAYNPSYMQGKPGYSKINEKELELPLQGAQPHSNFNKGNNLKVMQDTYGQKGYQNGQLRGEYNSSGYSRSFGAGNGYQENESGRSKGLSENSAKFENKNYPEHSQTSNSQAQSVKSIVSSVKIQIPNQPKIDWKNLALDKEDKSVSSKNGQVINKSVSQTSQEAQTPSSGMSEWKIVYKMETPKINSQMPIYYKPSLPSEKKLEMTNGNSIFGQNNNVKPFVEPSVDPRNFQTQEPSGTPKDSYRDKVSKQIENKARSDHSLQSKRTESPAENQTEREKGQVNQGGKKNSENRFSLDKFKGKDPLNKSGLQKLRQNILDFHRRSNDLGHYDDWCFGNELKNKGGEGSSSLNEEEKDYLSMSVLNKPFLKRLKVPEIQLGNINKSNKDNKEPSKEQTKTSSDKADLEAIKMTPNTQSVPINDITQGKHSLEQIDINTKPNLPITTESHNTTRNEPKRANDWSINFNAEPQNTRKPQATMKTEPQKSTEKLKVQKSSEKMDKVLESQKQKIEPPKVQVKSSAGAKVEKEQAEPQKYSPQLLLNQTFSSISYQVPPNIVNKPAASSTTKPSNDTEQPKSPEIKENPQKEDELLNAPNKPNPPVSNAVNQMTFTNHIAHIPNMGLMYVPTVSTITYSSLMMNMMAPHFQQTGLGPSAVHFNPQMMVYHNNMIVNPLFDQQATSYYVDPNANQNVQQNSQGNKQAKNAKATKNSSPKRDFKKQTIPTAYKEPNLNLGKDKLNQNINIRNQGNTEHFTAPNDILSPEICPEPEGTPPRLPAEPLEAYELGYNESPKRVMRDGIDFDAKVIHDLVHSNK